MTVRAAVLASETARPQRLCPPRRDVQTKERSAAPLIPNRWSAYEAIAVAVAVAVCGVNKQSGNLRPIGTEGRRGAAGRTTGPIERDEHVGKPKPGTCAAAIHPAAPGHHPRHISFHPQIQRHMSSHSTRAARPRATIVPHTLLLGQSGKAKKQGPNRF